jgi:uncharacterized damage-inducible protein DinB
VLRGDQAKGKTKMLRNELKPVAGVTREIGFYLAGMEEVRQQLREVLANVPDDCACRPAVACAHCIGALVLHIGEAEWYWMQMVILGHRLTDEDRGSAFWDVLKDPESFSERKYPTEFCFKEIQKIRDQTRETLSTFEDKDLDRFFTRKRRGQTNEHSLRWILHHLIDHEAQHKGQILMLKRFMGLKNEED